MKKAGDYFWERIHIDKAILFLQQDENVLNQNEVCLIHDKALCFEVLQAQGFLWQNGVDLLKIMNSLEVW